MIGRALSGKGTRGAPAFVYDFNFYSLLLVGFVIVVSGLLCLLSARGIARGDLLARRRALLSTLVILAVNVPLAPIQGFAYGLAILALFNLIGLAASRKRFRNAAD